MDMINGPADGEQADEQNATQNEEMQSGITAKGQAGKKQPTTILTDQTAEGQPGITTADQACSTRDVVKYGNIILLPVSVEKGDTTK